MLIYLDELVPDNFSCKIHLDYETRIYVMIEMLEREIKIPSSNVEYKIRMASKLIRESDYIDSREKFKLSVLVNELKKRHSKTFEKR